MKHTHSYLLAILSACALLACGGNPDQLPALSTTMMPPPVASTASEATFAEPRANYTISHDETGVTVTNISSKVAVVLKAAPRLKFSDVTVNLLVAQNSKTIASKDLNSLIDLYIAFFNRVPDADGLSYWIDTMRAGRSLEQISEYFYAAALMFPDLTGYNANMTNEAFIKVIYSNVLGRNGATAPPDADVKYWADELKNGRSKGSIISVMLTSARTFVNDKDWGWVPTLLDNKAKLGRYFAIEQGLNYNTYEESISKTIALVKAVTPTDYLEAQKKLGTSDAGFNLANSSGSGQGRMLDCFNPDLYAVGNVIREERVETKNGEIRGTNVDEFRVAGYVDFKGQRALEVVGSTVSTGEYGITDSPFKWYFGIGNGEFISYGDSFEDYSGLAGAKAVTLSIYNPGIRAPFSLGINEALSRTYTSKTEHPSRTIPDEQRRETVTFLGIEEVTVPAGVFSACKIKTVNFYDAYPNTITYNWFIASGPYRGFRAKTVDGGRWIFDAVKFSLNGK